MIEQMTKGELVSLWEKTQGGNIPTNRIGYPQLEIFYPLTNYFVKLVDGKPVAAIGFGKKDGLTLRGGAFVIESERGKRHYQELDKHLENNISGPYITGISSNVVPNEVWAKSFERRGWSVTPTDEELGKYANNSTIKAFKDYYDNHPRGAKWAVKDLPLEKSWFVLLKR